MTGDETAAEVSRREAELSWGVWLPLAFARMVQTVAGAFGGKPPPLSEILASFALPGLAGAAERGEEIERAEQTAAAFEALAVKYGINKPST